MSYPYKLLDVTDMGLSPEAERLYKACFRQGDGNFCLDSDDSLWGDVYLDNALSNVPFRGKQLSGLFSALEGKKLYRPMGYGFGEIRVEEIDEGAI